MNGSKRTPTATLSDAHRAMLEASAISDDVIQARGYWTATDKHELAQLSFAEHQQIIPALVVPNRSFEGEVVGHQIPARQSAHERRRQGREVRVASGF